MYLAEFLDDFLALVRQAKHSVKKIVVFRPYFDSNRAKEIAARYGYYGFADFIRMLRHIARNKILSFVFNLRGSGRCYSVNNVIKKYNLERYRTKSVNSRDFMEYVKADKIDLIVSVASPEIFKKDILKAPRKGCINYHTALLPKYRGRQPLFWALLNQEREVGVSVIKMDGGIDSGPIIAQQRIAVDSKDSLHSLYLKTVKIGPAVLADAIKKVESGCGDFIENNPESAIYNSFPSKQDAKLFKSKGKRFF